MVNWHARCGACAPVLADLAGLPALGVRVVIAVVGSGSDLDDERNLDVTVVLQHDGPITGFAGGGAPTAYLLDREGRVAAPGAQGAAEVRALARRLAGSE